MTGTSSNIQRYLNFVRAFLYVITTIIIWSLMTREYLINGKTWEVLIIFFVGLLLQAISVNMFGRSGS